jgi:hypothetical protein
MEMMIWNALLTGVMGLLMYNYKQKMDEINRLSILLNRTREEVARDHITRAEVRSDLEKIMERFDAGIAKLEAKIDDLAKAQRG